MAMLYSVRNVCDIFAISQTTLKNWADMAAPFLSEVARPPKGKHRSFTHDDLRVFAVVKSSPDYDAAFLALSNGQRGDVPTIATDIVSASESQRRIRALQDELMRMEADLEREKERRIEAEANVKLLRDMIRELMGKG